jgi:hypothetical protein
VLGPRAAILVLETAVRIKIKWLRGRRHFSAGTFNRGRVLAADARLARRFVCFGSVATRVDAHELLDAALTQSFDGAVLAVRAGRGLTAALDFRRGGPLLGGELR